MNSEDFVINTDGVLTEYHGSDANVVIPEGVTAIGNHVFCRRDFITSVTFPDSLTSIGRCVFMNCVNLTSLVIPGNVKSIGYYAFGGCESLTTAVFAEGVERVGSGVLERCVNLKSVTIPESIKFIGDSAFYGCTSLEEIFFSGEAEAFSGSGYEYVWNMLFYSELKILMMVAVLRDLFDLICNEEDIVRKLRSNKKKIIATASRTDDGKAVANLLTLQKSIKLEDIDEYIALGASAPSVTACLINRKHEDFSDEDLRKHEEIKFEKELGLRIKSVADWKKIFQIDIYGRNAVIRSYKGNDCIVEIPEKIGDCTVTSIWEDTFNPYAPRLTSAMSDVRESITEIIIPGTIKQLYPDTFLNCHGLENIYVSEENKNYSSDNDGVLYDKRKQELICCPAKNRASVFAIPDTVRVIGENCFENCVFLTSVTSGKAVEVIGDEAFRGCENLKSITIADSVTRIGPYAFFGCKKLKSINLPCGITEISDYMFTDCKRLDCVKIPDGVKRIGTGAFSGCKALISVTIPDSVVRIASDAFEDCDNVVFYCSRGSYGEFYARKYNLTFKHNIQD